MISSKLYFKVLLFSFLALIGCENSDDVNPSGVELEMKAIAQNASIRKSTLENSIVFTDVMLGVKEIEFEIEEDEFSAELEFEGRFIVDLLEGTSSPDFGFSNLVPGEYSEIEMELGPILPDGNSIKISFEYTKGGEAPILIEYSENEDFDIEIESEYGIEVEEDALSKVLILFDLDVFLSGIDFSNADVDSDGVIRINNDSNEELKEIFEDKIEEAFESGEDNDDDDEFDYDEDDD